MNHYQLIYRIALACILAVAAMANTAQSDLYDPYGLQYHSKPFGAYGPEFTAPNLSRWSNVLTGREPLNPRVAQRVTTVTSERFTDLNLSVNLPGRPWSKLDPKESGSRACLLLSRQNPEIMLSLAGEQVGVEAKTTNVTLLAESQTKMRSMPGAVLSNATDVSAGSIKGILYEATVGDAEGKTHYSLWVAAHNGYNYKLAVYGHQKDTPAIDTAIRNFIRGIKHIEPAKVAHTDSKVKAVEVAMNKGAAEDAEEPVLKSKNGVGAMLMLTEDDKFLSEWDERKSSKISPVSKAHRGIPIYVAVVLAGIGTDAAGIANVSYDVVILKPDYSVYSQEKELVGWRHEYQTKPAGLQLAEGYLAIIIKESDPNGTYTLEATVHDHIKNVDLVLEKKFQVAP